MRGILFGTCPATRRLKAFSALLILIAVPLTAGGMRLLWLRGSPYYLGAGLCLAMSGTLLWRGAALGRWLYALFFIGTLLWSFCEVGANGWALVPRIGLFVFLAFALIVVLAPSRRAALRVVAGGAALLLIVMTVAIVRSMPVHGSDVSGMSAWHVPQQNEWREVGHTAAADHFVSLAQITPANVQHLQVAWTAHLDTGPAESSLRVLEATPLQIGDTLYVCNARNVVIALDEETGQTRWRFDPEIDPKKMIVGLCRGVAHYTVPGAVGPCSSRILTATTDARMFALDAMTGRLCSDFGINGAINLREGMEPVKAGYYSVTSAPTIVRGRAVVGGLVLDGQEVGEPSGVVRAFDAITGKLAWAWDVGHPDRHDLPPGESYTRATPNAWAPMTADEELGLVYVPTGVGTPDYFGGYRTQTVEQYATSTVALDAQTGAVRWSFQTVHHDVWDYDNASPPTLIDFPTDQGRVPALIQPTKRGEFFVLDRRTGHPLVTTREKSVPQGAVAGDWVAETQPFPVGMPSFGGGTLRESDMWGLTPFDQLWCRIRFREARYDGPFTPVGLKPTIVYPGYMGGSEWGGVSIDPHHDMMVLNVNHLAAYDHLLPRSEADRLGYAPARAGALGPEATKVSPQAGTPYAAVVEPFLSPLGVPCTQPPHSEIAVVDLSRRQILWRQALGTGRDSGPFGIPSSLPITMGVPAIGGSLVTGSGLVFIAATQEHAIRAFDIRNGRLLWTGRLPAGGHATPMSYYSEQSGRQFVVVAASGHFLMRSGASDTLVAFALPAP